MFSTVTRVVILLIVFLIGTNVFAYRISGQLKNTRWRKGIKIGLSAINNIEQFKGMSPEQFINAADIDEDGNFQLVGNSLPSQKRFYRIYMREGDYFVLIQIRDQQNFIDLVLDNNSTVEINGNLDVAPLYQADVKGAPQSAQYLSFYQSIFYLLPSPSASPSQQAFNKEKVDSLIKTTIAKNNNPFYTILVLSSIDLRRYYLEAPRYFGELINELGDTTPNNIYAKGLEERKRVYDFEMSSVKQFLNVRFIILLLIIILLLSIALGYNILKTRLDQRASSMYVSDALASLTKKEKEIIQLMSLGKTNKEIASTLFIEISTVKTHANSIFQKFKVSNRGELLSCLQNRKLQPGVEP